MIATIKRAPPNSIVFISDIDGGVVPDPARWDRSPIHHSSSCICVGCYPEIDGETEFTLAPAVEAEIDASLELAFDGVIKTPSRQIMISDIDLDRLLSASVSEPETRIRIWLDNPKLPAKVVVGWG